MRRALFHDRISIMPFTQIEAVTGEPGAFQVRVRERTRQVDPDRCTGCGKCEEVCPVEVEDSFNESLSMRKAVFRPVPHNLPNFYLIDQDHCTKCGQCMIACPTGAIDLFVVDTTRQLDVGAILLAGGSGFFDPDPLRDQYGYGEHPNIVTSLQFERLLSAAGPTKGELRRPSDGGKVRRIAWIQCVGSRNLHMDRDYCSSICCMFALKEAVLAKEVAGNALETSIFYMDMRTFGKGFYRYQVRAQREKGVRLVRSRVHTVVPAEEGMLSIRYVDEDGEIRGESFDLVVLSTGAVPREENKALAQDLGVSVNQWGFPEPEGFSQVLTANPGVFLCGSMSGLKDISETLTQAGAAACEAVRFLSVRGYGGRPGEENQYEIRDVSRERPLAAVVLCRCKGEVANGISLERLRETIQTLCPQCPIVEADELCTQAGLEEAFRALEGTRSNRLLIGACLPQIYRQELKGLGLRLGLDPSLVDVFDLRSLSISGGASPQGVLKRAQILISEGLERLKAVDPVSPAKVPITQRALIVGGGIAGLTAALALSEAGYPVVLVEREDQLGGRLQTIHYTLEGDDPRRFLMETVERVQKDPRIEVLTGSRVLRHWGTLGNFHAVLEDASGDQRLVDHGIVIVATGAKEAQVDEYEYGRCPRIVTQAELEETLAQFSVSKEDLNTVVMIQCVGSREDSRPYCSRVCCRTALKNASKILERNPAAKIFIFYRDMMTYGFLEHHFTEARRKGILFFPYRLESKPQVSLEGDQPVVRFEDPVLKRPFEIRPDILVLSSGMVPRSSEEIASIFGLEMDEDGFLREADSKWRPVDSSREGIFICGTAHSPRSISESVAQALAAAARALAVLSRAEIRPAKTVADVKAGLCTRCELCIAACPYGARFLDEVEGRIGVDPLACQGCGACATACPSGAAFVIGMKDKQTMRVIDAVLEDAWHRAEAPEDAEASG
jgi:heterodisulfide reductase subunit A